MKNNQQRGFTLIEMLTVIAIILMLMGAITTSVSGARRRAKTQQAISEAQEMTNAILAYENYGRQGQVSPLEGKATGESWKEATEGELAFILGNESMPNGQDGNVPVLFNGAVRNGKLLDPWGHPYRYKILSSTLDQDDESGNVKESAFAFPNINRIPADEVN